MKWRGFLGPCRDCIWWKEWSVSEEEGLVKSRPILDRRSPHSITSYQPHITQLICLSFSSHSSFPRCPQSSTFLPSSPYCSLQTSLPLLISSTYCPEVESSGIIQRNASSCLQYTITLFKVIVSVFDLFDIYFHRANWTRANGWGWIKVCLSALTSDTNVGQLPNLTAVETEHSFQNQWTY